MFIIYLLQTVKKYLNRIFFSILITIELLVLFTSYFINYYTIIVIQTNSITNLIYSILFSSIILLFIISLYSTYLKTTSDYIIFEKNSKILNSILVMLNEEKFIENTDNKFVRNHDIVGIQEVIIHIFEKYAIKAPLEITGLIIDLLNEDKIKFDIKKSIVDDLELSS